MQTRTRRRSSSTEVDAFQTTGSSPTPVSTRVRVTLADGASCDVPVEVVGPESDRPPIVVLGGISASRHVVDGPGSAGWWSAIAGPGRAIDTDRQRVLSFDFVGGPGAPLEASARRVTTADQADALVAILDALGHSTCIVVGASYGGMVALAFAARHRCRCERLAVLCAAHRAHPMAVAWRALQRRIVRLGQQAGDAGCGVEIARGLAMTTYRSPAEFERRFAGDAEPGGGFRVESYLAARGAAFAGAFPADAYLRLSESIDTHAVEPSAVRVPVHLLAVRGDALVPPWLVEELRAGLAGPVVYRVIDSDYGHDGFLKEDAAVGEVVAGAVDGATRPSGPGPVTRTVRAAVGADAAHGAVMPPLYLSANYTFAGLGRKREHDYTRTSNPTRDQLADALADLEGGERAVVTSSGMSAVALVLQLLRPGEAVVATNDCYGGTHRLLRALAERAAIELHLVDLTVSDGLAAIAAVRPRLVWVETPSNPLLRITDLAGVAAAARSVDALVAVDNTLLSPALQRPLELGADVVVHSTTKFLNGHSDVVGGAAIAADASVGEELAWWANCIGVGGAPFDAYLTLRGLRTLNARVRCHLENTAALVELLGGHPAVSRVHYPGLRAHTGHAVAARQQSGWGSLVSFELAGGEIAVRVLAERLRCFSLAESLGGVESLIAHPATMTHAAMDAEARAAAGIDDALLRLSVGIEDAGDLCRDLRAGLDLAARVSS